MGRAKRFKCTHPALMLDDVLSCIAIHGLFVTSPMRGVCRTWRAAAVKHPRATLRTLATPSETLYARSGLMRRDSTHDVHDPTFVADQFYQRVTDWEGTEGTITQQRFLMLASLSRATFLKLGIRPVHQCQFYHLYNTEQALRVTLRHTDGVWGFLQRRYKDEHKTRHRTTLRTSDGRDAAIAFVKNGILTGAFAGIPAHATEELVRIASMYY